jgi:formylglycine-generating enzyme required for sulfatase activity
MQRAIKSARRKPGIIPIGNILLGRTSAACLIISALLLLQPGCRTSRQPTAASTFVHENRAEFVIDDDFNGDGLADVLLVDRVSGKFRIGWQKRGGVITWEGPFDSGVRYITGLSVGKVFDAKQDVLLVASADLNDITAMDLSAPEKIRKLELENLRPHILAAFTLSPTSKARHDTLFVNTIYNPEPDTVKSSLMQVRDGRLVTVRELPIYQPVRHAQRLAFRPGGREYIGAMLADTNTDSFIICDFSGTNYSRLRIDDLPHRTDFLVSKWQTAAYLVLYQPGSPEIALRTVTEKHDGLQIGAPVCFSFEAPVTQLYTAGKYLLALHGSDTPPSLWAFDARQTMRLWPATEHQFVNGAFVLGNQFGLLYRPPTEYRRTQSSNEYGLISFTGNTPSVLRAAALPDLFDYNRMLAATIRQSILEKSLIAAERDMKPYTNTIPETDVRNRMVPVPGGTFRMGSPATEKGRRADEGPQHHVKIEPFWMGQCEVTWNEYELYFDLYAREMVRKYRENVEKGRRWKTADAVSHPSEKLYIEMSFGMGKDGFPAIAMTPYAASMYCMWLSALTGEFYRLPTEAEWEYACRAGTSTAYSFGDDASKLPEYGWFADNSQQNGDWKYHQVGTRKPNPWGLYDMHGNVAEWCLDLYLPNYDLIAQVTTDLPWVPGAPLPPRVVRGGAFDFDAAECRSAARMFSKPEWQANEPQLPINRWRVSDANFVGFRIVRPLKVPSAIEMQRLWQCGKPGF